MKLPVAILYRPRKQSLNHPWNRGYPNNKKLQKEYERRRADKRTETVQP